MRRLALAVLLCAPAAAASDFPACDPAASSQTITFVHLTDLHARYELREDGVSAYARLRGKFEEIRRENPYTLFIDGGDEHEKGSLAETLSGGESTRLMTDAMRFDVRVLGNHDFGFGAAEAAAASKDSRAVVVASNLRWTGAKDLAFGATTYAELQVGCVRIGFLGLLTQPWDEWNEPFYGQYPGARADYDYAAVATRILSRRRVKPDLTVVVSHLGRGYDLELAQKVRGIDIILGGHSHGVTWDPILVGGTLVTEAGAFAEHLARADVNVPLKPRGKAKWAYDVFKLRDSMTPDPAVQKAAEEVERRWPAAKAPAAGCACRKPDAAEAAAAAARAAVETLGADAALVDLQTVWDPWDAGAVKPQDFHAAFRIERQPPGTPGFSAFYLAEADGKALAEFKRKLDPARWAYAGPAKPVAGRPYKLALPKRAAMHPDKALAPGFTLKHAVFKAEVWDALTRYARARQEKGLCVDDGCPFPGPKSPPSK